MLNEICIITPTVDEQRQVLEKLNQMGYRWITNEEATAIVPLISMGDDYSVLYPNANKTIQLSRYSYYERHRNRCQEVSIKLFEDYAAIINTSGYVIERIKLLKPRKMLL